ncbi:MAG: excinuclease ABC subunit UvrA [Pirellulaceae bacterium]|jgi:excinuclease ABC subunit A
MQPTAIHLRGIRTHNLRDLSLDIPLGQWISVCGVSGSGKTSLALDTLFAEGQRRFIESFSPYTRQYLQRYEKPPYDRIENLPAALAVARFGSVQTSRSTVGTTTETYDYLRLLFAKASIVRCTGCGQVVRASDPEAIASAASSLPLDTPFLLASPFSWSDRLDLSTKLADLQKQGWSRLGLAGKILRLGTDDLQTHLDRIPSDGEGWVLIDRGTSGKWNRRLGESAEAAFRVGNRKATLLAAADQETTKSAADNLVWLDQTPYLATFFGIQSICHTCRIDYPEPTANLFSFNHASGACPDCEGFGATISIDPDAVVPDPSKSIRQGAIAPWNTPSYRHELDELLALADDYEIPVDIPYSKLTKKQRRWIEDGVPERSFGGLKGFFAWLERKKYKMHVRIFLSRWRRYQTCAKCDGKRLTERSLAYRVGDLSIAEVARLSVDQLREWLAGKPWGNHQDTAAEGIIQDLQARLSFLQQVGLGYLTIDRTLKTLSGGEAQRVALTAALGASLTSMLYVLDEPTVGLHPAETEKLADAIAALRDRGNTVVVIEHELEMLQSADWILEVGPGAGVEGGNLVFQGTWDQLLLSNTRTAKALKSKPTSRQSNRIKPRQPSGQILLLGARGRNLQIPSVSFPLGCLCVVAGVSGSGKSSLIQETLQPALERQLSDPGDRLHASPTLPLDSLRIDGQLDEVLSIDQSPISRSPRSNPVTYLKAFDPIRECFARTDDARRLQMKNSHFSFNSELGRCEQCEGAGYLEVDMQFLADLQIRCPDCQGKRFRPEILQVRFRDRSIDQVLSMTADQATDFFRTEPEVQKRLEPLRRVGLGYLQLGQPATTLSSGEAQRLKLAAYLQPRKERTLFLFDEPTTGLHFDDVSTLLNCFDQLIESGHSVLVVEHNMQVIQAADWLIELGPGAAALGGRLIAQGTLEAINGSRDSVLKKWLVDQPEKKSRRKMKNPEHEARG